MISSLFLLLWNVLDKFIIKIRFLKSSLIFGIWSNRLEHRVELSKSLVYGCTIDAIISSCTHQFLVSFIHVLPYFRVIISLIKFLSLYLPESYTVYLYYLMAIYKIISCTVIKYEFTWKYCLCYFLYQAKLSFKKKGMQFCNFVQRHIPW